MHSRCYPIQTDSSPVTVSGANRRGMSGAHPIRQTQSLVTAAPRSDAFAIRALEAWPGSARASSLALGLLPMQALQGLTPTPDKEQGARQSSPQITRCPHVKPHCRRAARQHDSCGLRCMLPATVRRGVWNHLQYSCPI